MMVCAFWGLTPQSADAYFKDQCILIAPDDGQKKVKKILSLARSEAERVMQKRGRLSEGGVLHLLMTGGGGVVHVQLLVQLLHLLMTALQQAECLLMTTLL